MINFILNNFDTIFKNETSLETLDKLILDLAIKGKLVEQNPSDEPASELIKRIKAEKEQLIKEKVIKKEKPLPPIEEEEIPFDIPSNWEWVRMIDIGDYKKGPFGSALTKNIFVPKSKDTIKVYEQKNAIQKDWTLGDYYITKEYYEKKMKGFEVKKGDIIVSCAGTIGETYVLPNEIETGIINQALMRMRISQELNLDYFLIYFDYILKKFANKYSKGSAIKNIPPFDIFKKFVVTLPPLEEQKRIVSKIEKLQSIIKDLKEIYIKNQNNRENLKKSLLSEIESQSNDKELLKNLETIFTNFDKIIKTKEDIKDIRNLILSLAIKGKLVEQRESNEPASELIKRIKAEKEQLIKEKIIKKEKTLPPIEKEEIPFDIPSSWEWVRLKDISYLNPRNTVEDDLVTSFVPMKLIFDSYENNHLTEDKLWKDIKSGFTHFRNDDIGIAKITPCFENRKSVIFKNLKNGLGAGTTELYIVRCFSKDILNSYLFLRKL